MQYSSTKAAATTTPATFSRSAIGNLMTMSDFARPDDASIRLPQHAQPADGRAPTVNDLLR